MKTSIKKLKELDACDKYIEKLQQWYTNDHRFNIKDLLPKIVEIDDLADLAWLITSLDKELGPKYIRWCALQVSDKWNAPKVVTEYLKTGNTELRQKATAATAAYYATTATAHADANAAAAAAANAADAAGNLKPFIQKLEEIL